VLFETVDQRAAESGRAMTDSLAASGLSISLTPPLCKCWQPSCFTRHHDNATCRRQVTPLMQASITLAAWPAGGSRACPTPPGTLVRRYGRF